MKRKDLPAGGEAPPPAVRRKLADPQPPAKDPFTRSPDPPPPYIPQVIIPEEVKQLAVEAPHVESGGVVLANPSTTFVGSTLGPEHKIRDSKAREEERQGVLGARLVANDNTAQGLYYLYKLKAIFCNQLPNMPREYIARLVMDRKHRSVCIVRQEPGTDTGEKVIGGIHFRPFTQQGFIEIVFCAISADEQMRGYGTYVMNQLKKYARSEDIFHFITYADDFAIDYFKRQGFSKEIDLDRKVWGGQIKDYEGATMMYCRIDKRVDEDHVHIIRRQRKMTLEALQKLSYQHLKFAGIDGWKKLQIRRIAVQNLQILKMSGWKGEWYTDLLGAEAAAVAAINDDFYRRFKGDKDSWPFHTPVSAEEVPDYYTVIKDPVDLQTIAERLKAGHYYITQEMLTADLMRMMENCKKYNAKGSGYYEIAEKLEGRYLTKWRPVPLHQAHLPSSGYPTQHYATPTAGYATPGGYGQSYATPGGSAQSSGAYPYASAPSPSPYDISAYGGGSYHTPT